MTRGQLPQRAGSLGLNGGGTAAAVPPSDAMKEISINGENASGFSKLLVADDSKTL